MYLRFTANNKPLQIHANCQDSTWESIFVNCRLYEEKTNKIIKQYNLNLNLLGFDYSTIAGDAGWSYRINNCRRRSLQDVSNMW